MRRDGVVLWVRVSAPRLGNTNTGNGVGLGVSVRTGEREKVRGMVRVDRVDRVASQ